MTSAQCEEVRALTPEVALGIAPGEDRARVLAHTRSCPDCRRVLEGLAETADGLLLLAPSHEPSLGFESKVLERIGPPARRRSWTYAAVAAVAAAAIAGAGVFWSTAGDREIASHYRDALAEANGEYFGVYPLRSSQGDKEGNLFAYEGSPSWVFAVFEDIPAGRYTVEIETGSGDPVVLGPYEVQDGSATWGSDLPVDLSEVRTVRILDPRGTVMLESTFPS